MRHKPPMLLIESQRHHLPDIVTASVTIFLLLFLLFLRSFSPHLSYSLPFATLRQFATMAIFSAVPPPPPPPPEHQHPQSGVDVEAWTISALESLSVAPDARGTGVFLSIPLDESHGREATAKPKSADTRRVLEGTKFVRESQKNREAFLKGKEGSRRRQRWENGETSGHASLSRYAMLHKHLRANYDC